MLHRFSLVSFQLLILFLFKLSFINAQNPTFSQGELAGIDSSFGITSIMYGPDGRLYVAEYPSGEIKIYTIQRNGVADYEVAAEETLFGIQTMADHNDDGTLHASTERQVTGLTVAGNSANPVVYVASSDIRIGAGNVSNNNGNGDVNLDTNSGVITRFTWNGTSWDIVDLVRGLPRSEENHAPNGLEFTSINGTDYLIVASGGFTNAGGPSANFVYSSEYALSGAVLSINLDALNALPILSQNNRNYVYDLPTLDDPTRANLNGINDPDTINYDGVDVNDPFGGNDGLNQAVIVPGGPVQIFSPGYRNAYDLVVTEGGALYVTDNGANIGWGGFPVNEGGGNVTNDYDFAEPGSQSPSGNEQIDNVDHLEMVTNNLDGYVSGSFYAGHPNPTRANPSGAGLYTAPAANGTNGAIFRTLIYDPDGSRGAGYTTDASIALPANWPPVQSANPVEGDWRGPTVNNPDGPQDNPVALWGTNTNGIDEYTASNFGGVMRGNLLAGHSGGNIRRVELNTNGTLQNLSQTFLSGIGGNALGITCNGDFDIFPGTIWAGTFPGKIVVFEPSDAIICINPGEPGYDLLADYDDDGYTNQDEETNGTDACNGGLQPNDFDKSAGAPLESDLADLDDDNDGIADASDPFQLGNPDETGSDAFTIPISNGLFNNQQGLGGIFGLGLTGLMNNGDTGANWLDWIDRIDDPNDPNQNDVLGGAVGLMTSHMTSGTAFGTANSQEKGYQYGVQVDQSTGLFTVSGGLINFDGPLRLYGNTAVTNGELGLFIGDGTQSNYIKLVLTTSGVTASQEINDIPQAPIELSLPELNRPNSGIVFYFVVDPSSGVVDLQYAIDEGARNSIGTIIAQGSILNAIQQTTQDLAVGFIGSSSTSNVELEGTWDFLNVNQETENLVLRVNSGANQVIEEDKLFSDDISFVNGKTFANSEALVPELYQTERSSATKAFQYAFPVENGEYTVILHFAEIFWGATGKPAGQSGLRVFDVTIENMLVLDNYDIFADVGAETPVLKTFSTNVNDGILDIDFSALANVGGVNEPKVSAIEIIQNSNNQAPIAVAEATLVQGEAPLEVAFLSSNSTDDTGIVSYLWDFGDGNTSTEQNPMHIFTTAGLYSVTLTVEDIEGLTNTDTLTIDANTASSGVLVSGELKKWHNIRLLFTGPSTSEDAAVNPFLDYRLNVTFTSPTGQQKIIPGFYAADGNAAETSATSGDKWMIRFSPDEIGEWTYTTSFRTGSEIAISSSETDGTPTSFNGTNGTINITATDKVLPDNRSKGRLDYVGERYLQFQETGDYFIKAGSDSPENLLAYTDFDNTVASKNWSPHVQDWQVSDPIWQSNKGQGVIGAINYLADKGMNSFSFLTMNVIGDGKDVWPWTSTEHNQLDGNSSSERNNRLRYDVSKLEQWEKVFEHGDEKGMFLHFKTQETENDQLLDGGQLGTQRKLYYRELIARFGHHLAINWNLGEEYDIYGELGDPENLILKEYIAYINDLDPYKHPIVVHSFMFNDQTRLYGTLLGPAYEFSGPSIQSRIENIHKDVVKWVTDSENAGKPWVVSNDEQGDAQAGVSADSDFGGDQGSVADNRDAVRYKVLWGTLMGGGDGVEYYFGYSTGETDLTAQDFRSRAHKWDDAKVAIDFFQEHVPYTQMGSHDELISNNDGYCLAEVGNSYLIYLPSFEATTIDLTAESGTFSIEWFDPVNGGVLQQGGTQNVIAGGLADIGTPPAGAAVDWVILAKKLGTDIITVDPLANQNNILGDIIDLGILASGGDPNENFNYSISGQPEGVVVEPTNGMIFGTIGNNAATGGLNNDGIYLVDISVSKTGSTTVIQSFTWSVGSPVWTTKNGSENYTGRHENAFVQAGDKFYLFGGREAAKNIDIYDYTSNTWSTLVDSAPFEFNHFQAREYQGLIWVLGAFQDNNFPNETSAESVWAFDPSTENWIQGPQIPLSRRRGSAGLVVHNNKFYLIGGNTNGHSGGFVAFFDEYDSASGTWVTLEDAPRARDHFGAVVIDNKLYISGGRLTSITGGYFSSTISEVDVYDFATSTWSTLPSSQNLPTERAGASTVNFNNQLLVIGGEVDGETSALSISEQFNPSSGLWTQPADLNSPRHGTQAIVSGNGVYIASGSPFQGGGNQKNMEVLGVDSPIGTASISSTLVAPNLITVSTSSSAEVSLNVNNGNIGVMVTSMVISGSNADNFTIDSGELTYGFISANSTHNFSIGFNGVNENETATLIISYGNNEQIEIPLNVLVFIPPVADAGDDQTVNASINSVVLDGSESNDPDGGDIAVYEWTQQSGPSTATLNGTTMPELTVGNLEEGDYVFRLTVTDEEGDSDFDDVTVSVTAGGSDNFWLEAECAIIGSGWSVVDDSNASNGQYLKTPSGNSFNAAPSNSSSIVTFEFQADAGQYRVYTLAQAGSLADDSFWVRANNGVWVRWNLIAQSPSFIWDRVADSDNGQQPVTFDLVSGMNTIDIAHREDGILLDKLYVTNTIVVPAGLGGNSTNCEFISQPPVANAGADLSITLPTSTTALDGAGSFDPDGGAISSYVWIQQSGPSVANLNGNASAELTVSNLEEGDYVFRLTVTDDEGDTEFDDVTVSVTTNTGSFDSFWLEAECATVGSGWSVVDDSNASNGQYLQTPSGNNFNAAPSNSSSIVTFEFQADAGQYRVYNLVQAGSLGDDSFWVRANNGTWVRWNFIAQSATFIWDRVADSDNGQQAVTFDLVSGMNTIDIAHREDGVLLDKLYVTSTTDIPTGLGGNSNNCAFSSQAPVANAGANQNITLPTSSVVLDGSESNDPDGGDIAIYEWVQQSGPSVATLNGNASAQLVVSNLEEGNYVFRLTVTDDEGDTDFDDVTVSVTTGSSDGFWLEAECAIVGSGWSVVDDTNASNGQYLQTPLGNNFNAAPSSSSSIITFEFQANAGQYSVYSLVQAGSLGDDSFWVRANNGTWVRWNFIAQSATFIWDRVADTDNGQQPVTFDLVSGMNTIDIAHREDGVLLDKLYVTSTTEIPTGLDGNSNNCTSSGKSFTEANNVILSPNPSSVTTTLSFDKPIELMRIDVFDVLGRLVVTFNAIEVKNGADYLLNVDNIPTGTYFVKSRDENGNEYQEQMVIIN